MNLFNYSMGERIAILRIKQRMTREQLAEMVSITERFLYDIETGKKGCSNETLMRLSKTLYVSSDYLLTGKMSLWEKPFPLELTNMMGMLSTLSEGELCFVETIIRDCIDFSNRKHYLTVENKKLHT